MNDTIDENTANKFAIELIKLIDSHAWLATPLLYSAFFNAYYEGNLQVREFLEQCKNLPQIEVEKRIAMYFDEQYITNQNVLKLTQEYADAAHLFIDQSRLQNDNYKKNVLSLKEENEQQFLKNIQAADIEKNELSSSIVNIEDSRLLFEPKIADYEKIIKALQVRLNEASKNANTDHLTGILNRRSFDKSLKSWLERYKENKQSLCLAIFDIDYFKKFNDKYGHKTGDKVLLHFSQILKKEVRVQDYVFRYGGEEFTIIFPDTQQEDAFSIAERIRLKVASRPLCEREVGQVIDVVTVSCGLTQANEQDNVHSLFQRADENLYKAKQRGRNRIEASLA